jgi:ketopantoate reductase
MAKTGTPFAKTGFVSKGGPMEIDSMFSNPLAIARMMGVETPMLDLLVALAKIGVQVRCYAGAA